MSFRTDCPSCGKALVVPDDLASSTVTCPRCLAPVPTVYEVHPPPADVCPGCGRETAPAWRFCPYCETPLRGAQGGRRRDLADRDIQRDVKGTSAGLTILAILGGVGVLYFFFAVLPAAAEVRGMHGVLLVGLAFLAVVVVGIGMSARGRTPAARGVGRILVGTLAVVGVIVATGLAMLIAGVLFLLAMCGRNCGYRPH